MDDAERIERSDEVLSRFVKSLKDNDFDGAMECIFFRVGLAAEDYVNAALVATKDQMEQIFLGERFATLLTRSLCTPKQLSEIVESMESDFDPDRLSLDFDQNTLMLKIYTETPFFDVALENMQLSGVKRGLEEVGNSDEVMWSREIIWQEDSTELHLEFFHHPQSDRNCINPTPAFPVSAHIMQLYIEDKYEGNEEAFLRSYFKNDDWDTLWTPYENYLETEH